ncbi:MAG: EAL domain-containing protein [Microthrixaceae bacterium]
MALGLGSGSLTRRLVVLTALPVGLIVLGGVVAVLNGMNRLDEAERADALGHAAVSAVEVLDLLAADEVRFSVDVAERGAGSERLDPAELSGALDKLIGELDDLDLPIAITDPVTRLREQLPVLSERLRDDLSLDSEMARRYADLVDTVASLSSTLVRQAGITGIGEGTSDAASAIPLWVGFFAENRALTRYVASGKRSDRIEAEPAVEEFERDLEVANAEGTSTPPISLANETYDEVVAQVVDGVGLDVRPSLPDWQAAQIGRSDQLAGAILDRMEAFSQSVHHQHGEEVVKTVAMMILVLLTVIVTTVLMVRFTRNLARRLDQLGAEAEGVVAGDFSGIQPTDGTDEIDKVHNAFVKVAAQLSRFGTEAKRVSAAVAGNSSTARVDEAGFDGEWLELVGGLNQVNDAHMESSAQAERAQRRREHMQRIAEVFAHGVLLTPVFDSAGRDAMDALGAEQFEYWEYTADNTITLRFATSNLPAPGSEPVLTSVDRGEFDPLARKGRRFHDSLTAEVTAGGARLGLAIWFEADDDPEARTVADSIAALIATPDHNRGSSSDDDPGFAEGYSRTHDERSGLPNLGYLYAELEALIGGVGREASDTTVVRVVLTSVAVEERLDVLADDGILEAALGLLGEVSGPDGFVAHIGELDFVLLASEGDTRRLTERLQRDVPSGSTVLSGYPLRVAVGVVRLADVEQPTPSAVLIATRHACRVSHEHRRICFYSKDLGQAATDEARIRSKLVQTVTGGDMSGFNIEFQPELDLRRGVLCAVEALARWDIADCGRVPPDTFIRAAEEMDVITTLNRNLMSLAMTEFARVAPDACTLALNVSALDLQRGLADRVVSMADKVGIELSSLEIELTETAVVGEELVSRDELQRLRDHGCGITIDDFGSGFASIGYLTKFPVTKLKIDRIFVSECDRRPDAAAVIRHIVGLAHELGLVVVAEGIERREELELVTDAGCDIGQGYLLARPAPADELGTAAKGASEVLSSRTVALAAQRTVVTIPR